MRIQATQVFEQIEQAVKDEKRYIFLRGSSRSSKTISAVQWVILQALVTRGLIVTIARATQVSIKGTILEDFKFVMNQLGMFPSHDLINQDYIALIPL